MSLASLERTQYSGIIIITILLLIIIILNIKK